MNTRLMLALGVRRNYICRMDVVQVQEASVMVGNSRPNAISRTIDSEERTLHGPDFEIAASSEC